MVGSTLSGAGLLAAIIVFLGCSEAGGSGAAGAGGAGALYSIASIVIEPTGRSLFELPPDADLTGTNLWGYPAFKLWQFELGDTITAVETSGQPFSLVDFGGVPVDDGLWFGVSPDGANTTAYRVDPATNSATAAFEVTGLLRGIHRLR